MSAPVYVAIPARLASTRLPGKPLRELDGKPLIAHVVDRAKALANASVLVATDDDRIAALAKSMGVAVLLSDVPHATGTDRIAEAAAVCAWPDESIVVNLQGDEPLMPLSCLQAVIDALTSDPAAAAATLATPMTSITDVLDPSCVKVVVDHRERALYFSRAPIPWARDRWASGLDQLPHPPPLRHVGLYAYRAKTLRVIAKLAQSPLEQTESLEQLRLLENGLGIAVKMAPEPIPAGVDTPADLDRVSQVLRARRLDTRSVRSVLFVCMGNICRSPLAQYYAQKRLSDQGLTISVSSAGTLDYHAGQPADSGAVRMAKAFGLDLSTHRARAVSLSDFSRFDLILALDEQNLKDLQAYSPNCPTKVMRLLEFASQGKTLDVPDPYGKSQDAFAESMALIRQGVDGLVERILADGGSRLPGVST